MSSYEANWEIGLLVTAEAVCGIGFPPGDEPHEAPESSLLECAMDEAAD